ncbi:MAG: hypothetical protein J5J06_03395 [Phycisphaerae bacterium]|nr:hypothetical protein [Phycisphaerae bacterium]
MAPHPARAMFNSVNGNHCGSSRGKSHLNSVSVLLGFVAIIAAPVYGQCQWLPGDGAPGLYPTIAVAEAWTLWDPDGPGGQPELLVLGGEFSVVGKTVANNIAAWDGSNWSPLGTGMNDAVRAFTVFDDGSGPALYAGGEFTTAGGGKCQVHRQVGRLELVTPGNGDERFDLLTHRF